VENGIFGGQFVSLQFQQARLMWSTFSWLLSLQESKATSFQIEGFHETLAHREEFRVRKGKVKGAMSSKSNKGNRSGKIQIQVKDGFLKWERGDKRLSKMEEVLIMGLGFCQLFSLCINKNFLVGKWVANHL